jgi:MFS family permease
MHSTVEREASANAAGLKSAASSQNKGSNAHWHVLLVTWLGGVFDGMDSSIFAMVLFPALSDLLGTKSHAEVGMYGSYIIALFMLGWAAGAMFFGMLADYIGRARTLTLTILLYAICTGLCATAHTWWELGIYRFLVGAGIGGELGIGAVFLAESWPNKSRIQAVSVMSTSLGFGYLATASLNWMLGGFGWRALFVAGIMPAFLTFYIRSKMKESDHFQAAVRKRKSLAARKSHELTDEERQAQRWTIWQLLTPDNARKTAIVSILASVAIVCWWAVVAWIPAWINQLTGTLAVGERSTAMFAKDIGMILSGIVGGIWVLKLGYRKSMALSMLCAGVTAIGMFMTVKTYSLALLPWILSLGFFANLPFVVLWMYIPELYDSQIRSTAFGVSYNLGRFIAVGGVLCSGAMIHAFNGSYAIASSIVSTVYIIGIAAAAFMPKPTSDLLDKDKALVSICE